ncbi:hypothetical protein BGZ96_003574, partial [Linnemannia gamsii]
MDGYTRTSFPSDNNSRWYGILFDRDQERDDFQTFGAAILVASSSSPNANRLLQLVGGSLRAKRQVNDKVVIEVGLEQFSCKTRPSSLHESFQS